MAEPEPPSSIDRSASLTLPHPEVRAPERGEPRRTHWRGAGQTGPVLARTPTVIPGRAQRGEGDPGAEGLNRRAPPRSPGPKDCALAPGPPSPRCARPGVTGVDGPMERKNHRPSCPGLARARRRGRRPTCPRRGEVDERSEAGEGERPLWTSPAPSPGLRPTSPRRGEVEVAPVPTGGPGVHASDPDCRTNLRPSSPAERSEGKGIQGRKGLTGERRRDPLDPRIAPWLLDPLPLAALGRG